MKPSLKLCTLCARLTHASDPQFLEYRCPVFKGFVVTVSGFESKERMQVKQAIESEGGELKCVDAVTLYCIIIMVT